MHRILPAAIIAIIAILLAGCSSTPVEPGSAKKVPTDRIFGLQSAVSGGSTLAVSRDDGFWSSGGCYAAVLVDGKRVARMGTGEVAKFQVGPGRHIIGIAGDQDGNGMCALQIGQPAKEAATTLQPGEEQKFRISGAQDGLDIRPTSF